MFELELDYIKKALGLNAVCLDWEGQRSLPLFLRASSEIGLVETGGVKFLIARPVDSGGLPDAKRAHAQLAKRTDDPVVLSLPGADARQRQALVSHSIPFISAGKQAFLPFLGAASTEWGKGKLGHPRKSKLSPKAQQTAIWGALLSKDYTLTELKNATGMSASQASEAVSELAEKGLVKRSKNGRILVVQPAGIDILLDGHMEVLSSPIVQTVAVPCSVLMESLPDAGESALAARTMLNPPGVVQKAAPRDACACLKDSEVLVGELNDEETAQVQIWRYGPLFTDRKSIDDISLALSLADSDDERIATEINSLFGKEYPWRKAR